MHELVVETASPSGGVGCGGMRGMKAGEQVVRSDDSVGWRRKIREGFGWQRQWLVAVDCRGWVIGIELVAMDLSLVMRLVRRVCGIGFRWFCRLDGVTSRHCRVREG